MGKLKMISVDIETVKRFIRSTKLTAQISGLASIGRSGYYLDEVGWLRSFEKNMPVDKSGNPIPWFTYSMIHFLSERTDENMKVFEFGSGNSTIWWSNRVSRVFSCEHSKKWYNKIVKKSPNNVTYLLSEKYKNKYESLIKIPEDRFDVVVIDGKRRQECAKKSISKLKKNGVIVWDDTHRESYKSGISDLCKKGFRKLTFRGLKPTNSWLSETSVFYRDRNCLGI